MKTILVVAAWTMYLVSSIATAQTQTDTVAESLRYERPRIELQGVIGLENYDLKGNGSSVSASGSQAFDYGIEAYYKQTGSNLSLRLHVDQNETALKAPSTFSPSTVRTRTMRSYLAAGLSYFRDSGSNFWSPLEINFGYFFETRASDDTIPTALIAPYNKSGPLLGFNYSKTLNNDFQYNFSTYFFLTNAFKESSAITGYYNSSLAMQMKFMLMYPISKYLDLSFGAYLQYGTTTFYGSGNRGITDGVETTLEYGIPVEVLFFF